MSPFPKTQRDVITLTIDEDGDLLFLKTDSADIFMELGTTVTKRASHVEPGSRYDRWFFHLLRFLFGDKGRVAEWTRTWNCEWRINTSPIGGPILPERFRVRQQAIDREIVFLNQWFLER
jgi:hypothetical protein